MALQLPPLPPTEPAWSAFQVWWQEVKEAIEKNEQSQQIVLDEIDAALSGAEGVTGRFAILSSYTIPTMILTAYDPGASATIAIAAHVRRYGDTTQIAIAGDLIDGLAFATTYGVYYDDESRTNSTPDFIATADLETAQHNYVIGRHYCGTVTTPADGGFADYGGSPPAGSGYTAGADAQVIT